jgi:hypothetical protein
MTAQPATIRVWCRNQNLQSVAASITWAIGHRIEIPVDLSDSTNAYLFILTDIEHYESEETLLAQLGFDIIGKINGVISWEVLPREYNLLTNYQEQSEEANRMLLDMLDTLSLPISIVQHTNGTFVWKWLSAGGQAQSVLEAVQAALNHVMKSYTLIRSELLG